MNANGQPLVTVMIPTYNQEAYVLQAVNSALAQDYKNMEVVVADDCSTDGTRNVLSSLSDLKDARLKIIRNSTNLGRVGNYRNTLYHHARGEWVVNLDGDDFFTDSSFLSECAEIVATHPELVLVFADRFKTQKECEIPVPYPHLPVSKSHKTHTAESNSHRLFDGTKYILAWPNIHPRISHQTCFYKRALALARNFYSLDIISSDYESLFKLILGNKIAYLPRTVAAWREHGENASGNKTPLQRTEDFALFTSVSHFATTQENAAQIKPAEMTEAQWAKEFARWKECNIRRKIYTALLAYARTGEKEKRKEFASICMRGKNGKYKKQFLRVIFSPLTWTKILYHKTADAFRRVKKIKQIEEKDMIYLFVSTFNFSCKKIRSKHIPIEVGAKNRKSFLYDLRDDTGDNISAFNPYWGELTGLYWIWKNRKFRDDDIVGFCHYNKYLKITEKEIEDFFRVQPDGWIRSGKVKIDSHSHPNDLSVLRKILRDFFAPEYLAAWDSLYDSAGQSTGETCVPRQLFYARREQFDAYCSFLFGVLFRVFKAIGEVDRPIYYKRYLAHLGERLLSVYLLANKKPQKESQIIWVLPYHGLRQILKKIAAAGKFLGIRKTGRIYKYYRAIMDRMPTRSAYLNAERKNHASQDERENK